MNLDLNIPTESSEKKFLGRGTANGNVLSVTRSLHGISRNQVCPLGSRKETGSSK